MTAAPIYSAGDLTIDALNEALESAYRRSQANFARADKLALFIETVMKDEGWTMDDEWIRELVKEAGVECRECDGSGRIHDEVVVADYGSWFGDRSRTVVDECDVCRGTGKVLR